MEVRPPRRRSENPCTVDVAQKRSKQESMAKARAGKVPTGHREGGAPLVVSTPTGPVSYRGDGS